MEKILQSSIHLIVTARGKDEYTLEEKNGKQVPKKIGIGSEQEKSIEYNYTVSFNIDQENHVATVAKDNTHLFEGRYEMLTEKDGEKLANWANSGDAPTPKPVAQPETSVLPEDSMEVAVEQALEKLKSLFMEKMNGGVDKEALYGVVAMYHKSKNFMTIKDIDVAHKIISEMEKM